MICKIPAVFLFCYNKFMINKVCCAIGAFALLSAPWLVQAHTLKTDGQITVLLHTDPDDDPVAGREATILLSVTDPASQFNPADCDCLVTVAEKNRQLLSIHPPTSRQTSIYDFAVPITFPERAVYQITLSGTPKSAGQFQPFAVTYDLRVDRQVAPAPTQNAAIIVDLIIAILVLAGIITLGVRDRITYSQ
jgi:hypothetical protein